MTSCKAEVGPSQSPIGRPSCQALLDIAGKVDDRIEDILHAPMASLPRRLLLQSRQCPSRIRCRASPQYTTRPLSTTPRLLAKDDTKPGSATTAAAPPPGAQLQAAASQVEQYQPTEEETTAAQLARLVTDLKALDPDVVSDALRKGKRGIPFATDFELENDEHFEVQEDDKRKIAAGFWAEGEESMGPDEDYYGDDLTSHGHGELAQHRQLREYNRLVAWELPLLNRTSHPIIKTITMSRTTHKLTIPSRTRPALHTPHIRHPLPLPLHLIPQRIAPSNQQSRRRVCARRPLSQGRLSRVQTNQARRPTLQPLDKNHQALVREIRHAGAEQALPG
jgi:hypothetical protein